MNKRIYIQCNQAEREWKPAMPPARLQMLLLNLNPKDTEHSLILTKEVDGLCDLVMKAPGNPECALVISELTEIQARCFAISYLENREAMVQLTTAIDAGDTPAVEKAIELMTTTPELDTNGRQMFPEWLRSNYHADPECFKKAADNLTTHKLSAGSGIKIIISDHAFFADSSRADIILSATDKKQEKPVVSDADILLHTAIKGGMIVLGTAAVLALGRKLLRKL